MKEDSFSKIVSVLSVHSPNIDAEILSDRSRKLEELDLDSLQIMEIVYELEEYFCHNISEIQLQALATIDDLVSAFDAAKKIKT